MTNNGNIVLQDGEGGQGFAIRKIKYPKLLSTIKKYYNQKDGYLDFNCNNTFIIRGGKDILKNKNWGDHIEIREGWMTYASIEKKSA